MKHKAKVNESTEEKEIMTNDNTENVEINEEVNEPVDSTEDVEINEEINEPVDNTDEVNEETEESNLVDDTTETNEEPLPEESTNEIVEEPTAKEGKVSCGKLNVRSAAIKDADIVFVMDKDSVVNILDDSDDTFYRISYNGNEGYCMKEFIEIL